MNNVLLITILTTLLGLPLSEVSYSKEPSDASVGNLVNVLNALRVNARNCGVSSAEGLKFEVLNLLAGYGYDGVQLENYIETGYRIEQELIGNTCNESHVQTYLTGFRTEYELMQKTLSE